MTDVDALCTIDMSNKANTSRRPRDTLKLLAASSTATAQSAQKARLGESIGGQLADVPFVSGNGAHAPSTGQYPHIDEADVHAAHDHSAAPHVSLSDDATAAISAPSNKKIKTGRVGAAMARGRGTGAVNKQGKR